jgi:hypothetical protein
VPPGFDTWDFGCKVGADTTTAEPRTLRELSAAIDAVATAGAKSVYLEILAIPARRDSQSHTAAVARPPTESSSPSNVP